MADSDFESGDPWDVAPATPEPPVVVDADEATSDAPEPPPPPPASIEGDPAQIEDEQAPAESPIEEIEVPDFDIEPAEDAEPPALDVPDLDMTDIASTVEVPDVEGDELDIDAIVTDIDLEDVTTEALEEAAAGIAMDEPEAEGFETTPSRGPLSAMLASTGLFGEGDTHAMETPEPDIDLPEDAGGVADAVAGVDEFTLGDSEPPSVYRELEDLAPGLDAAPPETPEVEGAGDPDVADRLEHVDIAVGEVVEDAEEVVEHAEEVVEDVGAEAFPHDEPTADLEEPTEPEAPTVDGEEPAADSEADDIARVAALVSEVEPVVEGADDAVDVGGDVVAPVPADLDWLDNADLDEEASALEVDDEPEALGASEFSIPELRYEEPDVEGLVEGDGALADPYAPEDAVDETGAADADMEEDLASEDLIEEVDLEGEDEADVEGEDEDVAMTGIGEGPSDPFADLAAPGGDEASALIADDGFAGASVDTVPQVPDDASELLDEPPPIAGVAAAHWGSRWEESQQGWVDGHWRPIVATSDTLAAWTVDVYLGVVVGDAVVVDQDTSGLSEARAEAESAMVNEATARGAHAVLGVTSRLHQLGGQSIVSSTGTAVTLVAKDVDAS